MATTTKTRKGYTPKSDEQRNAELAEAHALIVAEVEKITSDDEWRAWLDALAKFHNYSFSNVILAWAQLLQRKMQPPTRLASFGTWKSLDRSVIKGQRGLMIYAPIIVPIKEGEKGYVPGEKRTKLVGFKIVKTFDLQQTEGKPLPSAPEGQEVSGDAPAGLWDALEAFAVANDYSVHMRTSRVQPSADGETDQFSREISVNPKIESTARRAYTLAHEIAHMLLHTTDDDGNAYDYRAHRGVAETEAESVAYLVARHFGVETNTEAFHYVAGWAKDPETVIKVGQRVQATAKKIITAVEKSLPASDAA